MTLNRPKLFFSALIGSLMVLGSFMHAPTARSTEESSEEKPYSIAEDGTVSWAIYSGYRRYNAICYTCHGPDGVGSSFAPALTESLKTMTYDQFLEIVVNGKETIDRANEKKMPALGVDPNVMCFIDDIYGYLKARSDGALGRGRPAKHEDKTEEVKQAETACLGL